EEAPREILPHRVHRAGRVHQAEDHRVRLLARVRDHVPVDQVVVVEREAPRRLRFRRGRRVEAVADAMLDDRHPAAGALPGGAPLVEADAGGGPAVAPSLGQPEGPDLAPGPAPGGGQLEVLEHDVDQLLERDVGLVVVGARLVAGLVLAGALGAGLADYLAALGVAVTLADARRVVAVDEAILADPADRHLDDAIAV